MRTRLPVRFKLAVVTAALTFGILCIFAVVIGAVAEQRVRAGFDDDLRASAADIVNALDAHRNADGGVDWNPDALTGVANAQVRFVDLANNVVYPEGLYPLAAPGYEGLSSFQDLRVASRDVTVSNRRIADAPLAPLGDDTLATVIGFVQYAKPLATVNHTINRVRLFLGFGVLGGTLLAFLGGLYVAERAMRPIAGLTSSCPSHVPTTRYRTSRTRSRRCSASWAPPARRPRPRLTASARSSRTPRTSCAPR
jgi:hypothetical protein